MLFSCVRWFAFDASPDADLVVHARRPLLRATCQRVAAHATSKNPRQKPHFIAAKHFATQRKRGKSREPPKLERAQARSSEADTGEKREALEDGCDADVSEGMRGQARGTLALYALLATACIGKSARRDTPATASTTPAAVETEPVIEVPSTTSAECVAPTGDGSSKPGHGLLAIDPRVSPYKPNILERYLPRGAVFAAILCLCVDEQGTVTDVKMIARTTSDIDARIAKALWNWRFNPYIVDGQPTPFCYPVNYTVR
jgi:hypothetical protein